MTTRCSPTANGPASCQAAEGTQVTDSVRQAADAVGLDYAAARSGSVDEICQTELGRDILAEPTLLFASAVSAR